MHGWDGTGINNDINISCVILAHRLLHAARVMFDTAGDAANAAMVRCNLSSLLRMRSNWEMNCYRTKAKEIKTPSTPISSQEPATGNAAAVKSSVPVTGDKSSSSTASEDAFGKYRESYRLALGHLKHAQRQCDYAVLALGTPYSSPSPHLPPPFLLPRLPLSPTFTLHL